MNAMKKQTKEELAKSRWWWRHATNIFTHNERSHTTKPLPLDHNVWKNGWRIDGKPVVMEHHTWNEGAEWGAYQYELARRSTRMPKLPAWPKLNADEMEFVRLLFGKSQVLYWSNSAPQKCYSDSQHWNLSMTDGALRTGFLEWIAEQRLKHGIPQPKGRAGQVSKSPSWLWPEMLDLAANGMRADRCFDSGTHSRAKKLSAQLAERFMQALSKKTDRSRLFPKIVSCK